MKGRQNIARWFWVAWLAAGLACRGFAGTNAVTVTGGFSGSGAVQGAAGFYFVPAASISITNVSFLDAKFFQDAIVSIWAGTNSVLTNYHFGATTNSQATLSSNVSFALTAGQPYSITVQDTALSSGLYVSVQAYVNQTNQVEFTTAPEMLQYRAMTVGTDGTFSPGLTNSFLYGVNFGFLNTNGPPLLRIADFPSSNSVVVSWLSPSTGFVLETNGSVATNAWSAFLGAINDDGTNKSVVISPPVTNLFFRLKQ